MSTTFKQQLRAYAEWKQQLLDSIENYQVWLAKHHYAEPVITDCIHNMRLDLQSNKITLAFTAEFSRGKTELINAMFFGETGNRLLPSSPGRTTMCPTEVFHDPDNGSYLRLLPIETRLNDKPLTDYKEDREAWHHMELDYTSPKQMQEAFKELVAVKKVSVDEAKNMGLHHCFDIKQTDQDTIEIPCWRHAEISYPHPLLKDGLVILDTPGLNALGAEPELTLNMLPNAQAIIFVLAADTGVTKSDFQLWEHYIKKHTDQDQKGLTVAMNKIDTLWDDLVDDTTIDTLIEKQVSSVAHILELDPQLIFPVSAKQGLISKVKSNQNLLEKSRIRTLEDYLSNELLQQRQQILLQNINREFNYLVDESFLTVASRIEHTRKQITDLKSLKASKLESVSTLLTDARKEQKQYIGNVESFQLSRAKFTKQTQLLHASLHPGKADEVVRRTEIQMTESLTTVGMKSIMKELFAYLDAILMEAVTTTEHTRELVKGIYRNFARAGLEHLVPVLFSLGKYQVALEQLFKDAEAFRKSPLTTFTEQNRVINKLYTSIVSEATKLLKQAYTDSRIWATIALTPLERQIKAQKKQLEEQIKMLNEIKTSSATVEVNMQQLKQQLVDSIQQHEELVVVKQSIQAATLTPLSNTGEVIADTDNTPIDADSPLPTAISQCFPTAESLNRVI